MKDKIKFLLNLAEIIYNSANNAVKKILEVIYPSSIYCICCQRPIERSSLYSLCDDCLADIKWANGKLCRVCGKVLEEWYPEDICGECKNADRAFDNGISCFQYSDMERLMIKEFKYHGKSYMARIFSEMLKDKIEALGMEGMQYDLVIPVPMFSKKEKQRGYNQAALLGKYTAERLGIHFREDLLIRVRNTVPMNRLNPKERAKNIENAFRLRYGTERFVEGKRVLLVDDIYTTGSTVQQCSEILKVAGAWKVTVLSLASGKNQIPLPDLSEMLEE